MKDIKIRLCYDQISIEEAVSFISVRNHGAQCIFSGTVREQNLGKQVVGIDYDVYESLANFILRQIVDEAVKDFDESALIFIAHLIGHVVPGQISMCVAVSTAHREDAYRLNRFIVEAIKHQVPIWKKEYYSDGTYSWLQGCPVHHKRVSNDAC